MSTDIRLAAGHIDGATLLSTDSYLITNFPKQNDQTPSYQWLATQPDSPALQTFVPSLEVGSGRYYGKFSTSLQFLLLSEDMRYYLHNTIMGNSPVAPVTVYVEHPYLGFGVYQGEMITPYASNMASFVRQEQDAYTENIFQLTRLTRFTVGLLELSDSSLFALSDGSNLVIG